MNTAAIINVSSVATNSASTGKGNGVSPSDQSFGHVLSREVNANSDARNNADNKVGSSQAGDSTAPSTATGKTKSDNDKTKSTADASAAAVTNADTGSTSGSAQILALVANVQQSDSNNSSTPASTAAVSDSMITDKLAGGLGSSAQSASNDFQTAAADSGKATNPAAALAAATTGNSPFSPAIALKSSKLMDSTTQPTSADLGAVNAKSTPLEQPVVNLSANDADVKSSGLPALDLGATAEKGIQAGLSALDANAVKITLSAPAIVPTAIPQVMFNAQVLPSNPTDKLTPQVGSAGWDQALGQKVVWMVAGGQQSASLTLNPPDLGPMQVVLNVTNSHATATFTAAQPEVRQALEAAMPKLREMLGDAGIQLGQTTVNSGAAQQQNTFADQNAKNSNSSRFSNTIGTGETSIAVTRTSTATSAGLGLVDTFA